MKQRLKKKLSKGDFAWQKQEPNGRVRYMTKAEIQQSKAVLARIDALPL